LPDAEAAKLRGADRITQIIIIIIITMLKISEYRNTTGHILRSETGSSNY